MIARKHVRNPGKDLVQLLRGKIALSVRKRRNMKNTRIDYSETKNIPLLG